ncbi:MAG: hypothetical protein P8L20_05545 [Flavobacteriales bacterium]|nr:hypothetical protein [Flavobacteriales bacterium]
MKKDIHVPKVEGIGVAIIKDTEEGDEIWNVYLINYKEEPINNVLISSKGYGTLNQKKVNTSTLRHFFDVIKGQSYQLIEPISEDVFGLSNEYFVTFYIDNIIYDKKFVFVPDTIKDDHFTKVRIIQKDGVLIK